MSSSESVPTPRIIYAGRDYVACVKPCGVSSQDVPGGMPELLRAELGADAAPLTVHRLDRETGGVMVYALTPRAAAELSREIAERQLEKRYLAVTCAAPDALPAGEGSLRDLLYHDRVKNKTYVVGRPRASVREAVLEYRCIATDANTSDTADTVVAPLSLYDIRLLTGRTHQIRAQLSSRRAPLLGDTRYGGRRAAAMGLWSYRLSLRDPTSGERRTFICLPPAEHPAFAPFRQQIQCFKEEDI